MTVYLRKRGGGADSYGHVWRTDKSVVAVSDEQAADLLAIADAGFTVVEDPDFAEDAREDGSAVTEVDPDPADVVTEPEPEQEKPHRRPRKHTRSAASVEE